jgi:hypothetical protein
MACLGIMMKNIKQPYETLPDGSTSIWRYIDLPKLLSLFERRSLFLCRADRLGDQFEGSFTKGSLDDFQSEWGSEFRADHRQYWTLAPRWSYVSCWHAADFESAALWAVYGGGNAVAIRSTLDRLTAAVPDSDTRNGNTLISQGVRRVVYIDYKSTHPHLNDLMGPLCYKRLAYSYESEIRAIRQELRDVESTDRPGGRALDANAPPGESGREIPVKLEELLTAVYVVPRAPQWYFETVAAVMRRYGLNGVPCYQSSLDDLPEFGIGTVGIT